MRGINTVLIMGRLGKSLESKQTTTGRTFVDLQIATNRPFKQNDTWRESTDWHQVRFWGKQAETCCKFLEKGTLVAVEGSLKTDQWTSDNGNKQFRTYILGQQLHLLPQKQVSLKELLPEQ